MQYNKTQVVARLTEVMSPSDAEKVYQDVFKAVRTDDVRGELLAQYVTRKEGAQRNSQGEQPMTSQQSNIVDPNSVKELTRSYDFGYGVHVEVSASRREQGKYVLSEGTWLVTCDNCKDGATNIGEKSGSSAQHAINASTDWFFYREYLKEYTAHIEPGMRLNVSKEAFDAALKDPNGYYESGLGLVGPRYNGDYFGLRVRKAYWREITQKYGRVKTENHWMPEDQLLKWGFVDSILLGYKLVIDLQHVGWSWLCTVITNLDNPNKDQGWADYQEAKKAASAAAEAKKTGNKIEALYRAAGQADASPELIQKAAEVKEKSNLIYVQNGRGVVVHSFVADCVDKETGEPIPVLPTGKYSIMNTRGSVVNKSQNYTGTEISLKEFRGYATRGYVLAKA